MSHKHLFTQALGAQEREGRLHLAAHSHHLWPDASFEGQRRCWEDGAFLADRKWDRVMGEVWPAAQAQVAAELNLPDPSTIVFASNTHELMLRLLSARTEKPVRVLSSDGEFHSFRRQAARWVESGRITLETVPVAPFESFADRFLDAARERRHDLIFVSQVFFNSGHVFDRFAELAALADPEGCWVAIDGYHGFMAVETDLSAVADRLIFVAGGYKYAMAGEGVGFMHCPPGFGARPEISGWYAEFDDLSLPPGTIGYAPDARRFLGATFDPSGLYRFVAVREMLAREGLTTAAIATHVAALQQRLAERLDRTRFAGAELINPPDGGAHARFLALRSQEAQSWYRQLAEAGVTVDVRGDVLRIGLGLYHDASDIELFLERSRGIASAP
ncbi:aminotransferase class V-fold PLP-dependent enzyme [Sphingomonas cavernae]|uniref:Aminotransferase class V-fold PLP-dependent enzyme n=1 Tax=Sphingomonas cavernae TaxID=2320861 RepID=A0A418WS27_9SPHN|nr:aminotransferase class V-fold PLP-dependent enzyme [Sphingomonas cavernae]RJF93996.1 aminotransferase class V-fold PLP-dependent enzyme [Sphingomonas cavernae]